jgi:hypothetical protein
MRMRIIENWMGKPIEISHSDGNVLVTVNPFDNLISTGVSPWPPPEVIQKLYRSRQMRCFKKRKQDVTRVMSYYTDLQSIHSEDAFTWSIFGTLAYASQDIKCAYVTSLLNCLEVPHLSITGVNIWLWRRIPHPDNQVSGGPEIDFGIQMNDSVIFGEAKWLSKEGKDQGIDKNKTQLTLRREFFEKYGKQIFPGVSNYIVLGLSLEAGMLDNTKFDLGHAELFQRDITWETICGLKSHHLAAEVEDYFLWKVRYS